MPIDITGKFTPSGGPGAFKLYDVIDIDTGTMAASVVWTLGAAGRITAGGTAGEIVVQTGAGTPVHAATEGTPYWDTTNNILYVNNNSATGWTAVGSVTGSSGSGSIPGPEGPEGPEGPPGPPGSQGAVGITGATGPQGPIGIPGDDGADGMDGTPGPMGATGPAGSTGATGPQGSIGIPGEDGIDGADGFPGPMGSPGAMGATGPQGSIGIPGIDGEDGFDGFPGPMGPAGAAGAAGAAGMMGPPGMDGFEGIDGPPGPSGGGIQFHDETSPAVATKQDVHIMGGGAFVQDNQGRTEIVVGTVYDAIVDSADTNAAGKGNVYSTLQAAITAGHNSILFRSSTDSSNITIGSGDGVTRIVGDSTTTASIPVNITCQKGAVLFESLTFAGTVLRFEAGQCRAFACIFSGTRLIPQAVLNEAIDGTETGFDFISGTNGGMVGGYWRVENEYGGHTTASGDPTSGTLVVARGHFYTGRWPHASGMPIYNVGTGHLEIAASNCEITACFWVGCSSADTNCVWIEATGAGTRITACVFLSNTTLHCIAISAKDIVAAGDPAGIEVVGSKFSGNTNKHAIISNFSPVNVATNNHINTPKINGCSFSGFNNAALAMCMVRGNVAGNTFVSGNTTASTRTNTVNLAAAANVTFDAASTNSVSGAVTSTHAHTTAVQNNRILIVTISQRNNTTGITSVTYNGVAMTQIGASIVNTTPTPDVSVAMFYLLAPATGANNVVVTFAGATTDATIGASTYYNAAQQAPNGTQTITGNGTTSTVSVTTGAGVGPGASMIVDVVGVTGTPALTVGAAQTANHNNTNISISSGSSREIGGTSVAMSWSWTGAQDYAQIAVNLDPVFVTGMLLTDLAIPFDTDGGTVGTRPDMGIVEIGSELIAYSERKTGITNGTATATSATTLTDGGAAWGTANQYNGQVLVADTSWGLIQTHTATVMTVDSWRGGTPAATAAYAVRASLCNLVRTLAGTTAVAVTEGSLINYRSEIGVKILQGGIATSAQATVVSGNTFSVVHTPVYNESDTGPSGGAAAGASSFLFTGNTITQCTYLYSGANFSFVGNILGGTMTVDMRSGTNQLQAFNTLVASGQITYTNAPATAMFWQNMVTALGVSTMYRVPASKNVELGATAGDITPIVIPLTNKTGSTSVINQVVTIDPATNNSFVNNTGAQARTTVGVVMENGIADGSACMVAVAGVVEVLCVAANSRGDVLETSATAGQAQVAGSGRAGFGVVQVAASGAGTLAKIHLSPVAATTDAGTYTPTLTGVANVAASTAYQCQYMRVGSTVTVSGKVDVDPTAAVATQLGISLPIASNLGAVEDCAGAASAFAVAGQSAAIIGDAANNRAEMQWVAVDLTNRAMFFTFTYEII